MKFKLLAFVLLVVIVGAVAVNSASAESPSRVRELTCSDGTIFIGEQVRAGLGTPPNTWRNVNQSEFPTAFVFHEAAVISPTGQAVEDFTWDHAQGVANNHELVTCSFIIPVGDLAGYRADFIGYFVP